MLLRHSFLYVLARGLPGVVSFAALALYTRLLAPEEFGRYALVLAGIGLAEVVVFQWLRLVFSRFLPAHLDNPHPFLSGILAQFLLLALLFTGVGATIALLWPDPVWQRLLALAVPLLLIQAWFQFDLAYASARLDPARYGRLLGSKSLLALVVGAWLAWVGLGAFAPLIGLLVGHVLSILLFGLSAWKGVRPRWPQAAVLREQLSYGLPLTVTFALGWIISSSDRLLIGWLLDDHAVGVYAVGYDLAQQSLGLLLVIIYTAAFPLAVNALEREGGEAARVQVAANGALILSVAFAGAAGLAVLSPQLIAVLVGEQFQEGAQAVLPWVALSAAIAGIKAFHFDVAFHLSAESRGLVVTGGLAALANVGMNLILIPAYGIVGAAWATVTAFTVAAISSVVLGRRVFQMPAVLPLVVQGLLIASAAAAGAGIGVQWASGVVALLTGVIAGSGCAAVMALVVNLAGARDSILRYLCR